MVHRDLQADFRDGGVHPVSKSREGKVGSSTSFTQGRYLSSAGRPGPVVEVGVPVYRVKQRG